MPYSAALEGTSVASKRSAAAGAAARTYQTMADEAYGIGVPGLTARNAALMPALRQAEAGQLPGYIQEAFNVQRTGLAEGASARERSAIGAQDMASKGARAGGNAFATMNPAQQGALLADAMMGSRVQQGMATVNQANTLMQMGMGGAASAGNEAIGAAGNNLRAIGMLPNYNPTYAAILGGVNAAGTIYGAGKQSGWWGAGPQLQTLPPSTAYPPTIVGGGGW